MKHEYSSYALILLGAILLAGFAISVLDSQDVDELCATNNKILKRINGVWQCGTDALFNQTQLNASQFVNQNYNITLKASYIEGLCYNTEAELTTLLNDNYVSSTDVSYMKNASTNGYDFKSLVHIDLGTGSIPTLSTGTMALMQRNDLTTRGAGIAIVSGTAGQSFIDLGDTGDVDIGRVLYGQGDNQLRLSANNSVRLRINTSGIISSGTVEAPGTELLSPIRLKGQKLVSKSIVSSGDNTGALEYANNTLYFTNWKVRRTVVQAQEVVIANQTVINSAAETTIFNQPHGADYLITGKMEDILVQGIVNTGSGVNDGGKIIIRYAGSELGNFTIPKTLVKKNIEIHVMTTVRATGAGTTSIQVHANADIEGSTADPVLNTMKSGLSSTTQQNTTISVKFTSANTNNWITVLQGRSLSIDDNQKS